VQEVVFEEEVVETFNINEVVKFKVLLWHCAIEKNNSYVAKLDLIIYLSREIYFRQVSHIKHAS